ncbi:hypothetical protein G6011_00514 [Alternaria panax]|uniref:EthD domain-containing protein n=1 Tax=Alternaria panax TaxID=48097 RepID=A0AAD4IIE9_9PLEO|nr:hypothetical protein G6011_00514 [Alternaria panax]
MPISFIYFYLRRPDVTPEHFRSYMEETHVPLIKEVFEMHPLQSLRLRYIVRVKTGAGDRLGAVTSSRGRADPDAPVVLIGSPKDVDWDAMGEMVFRDELHVQQCLAVMNGPGGQRIKEDEETIAITEKTRVILMGEESTFL